MLSALCAGVHVDTQWSITKRVCVRRATCEDDAMFVAREEELGRLTSALDDALAGRGRLFVVSGPVRFYV